MSLSNSDKIKQDIDFLRHDVNLKNDYQLVKSGRSVLNLKKEQLFKTLHGQVLNYFLNCKNNYCEYPFNGSSSFYVDFDIPNHTVSGVKITKMDIKVTNDYLFNPTWNSLGGQDPDSE